MWLEKDGITVEIFHDAEIARFKRLGYKTVVEPKAAVPVVKSDPKPELTQQEIDQATVERIVQPEKGKKVKHEAT